MQRQQLKHMQRKLQDSLTRVQEELGAQEFEGVSGGGAVKVMVNGQQDIQSIRLDRSVVDPENVELLEDLIMTAIKDGTQKAGDAANQKVGAMNIPGINNILNMPGFPKLF